MNFNHILYLKLIIFDFTTIHTIRSAKALP